MFYFLIVFYKISKQIVCQSMLYEKMANNIHIRIKAADILSCNGAKQQRRIIIHRCYISKYLIIKDF